jgi:hypothetical protein
VDSPDSVRPRWWQWFIILSIDAPAVALVWQAMFARIAGVQLGCAPAIVLGLSVWLAYTADRWIEGWRLPDEQTKTPRHRFYQQQRWPMAFLWLVVLAGDVTVAFTGLTTSELLSGWVLLVPVLAYLLSHQLVHRNSRWRAPKELCVAALLAAGAALFPLDRAPHAARLLAPALGLFALLCFVNCVLISVWEREVDAIQGQTSLAQQFRAATEWSHTLPWMVALIALIFALSETGAPRAAAASACGSGVLLWLIHRYEPKLGWKLSRLLADAALLTPILPLLVERLQS